LTRDTDHFKRRDLLPRRTSPPPGQLLGPGRACHPCPQRGHFPPFIMSTNEPNKVIYSMIGVSKAYDKKVVLKDIYLSYFYGAKIGVLGLNGAGKSTLLRILAGVEKNFDGQTIVAPGYTTGYLEQEPHLDATKTVKEIV